MTDTTLFPDGFLFGAAVSAHQVEGGNTNNDWWWWEHLEATPCREPSGDACDFYHRYREDIELMAGCGLNSFRFGIEWARIERRRGSSHALPSRTTGGCSMRATSTALFHS